MSPRSIALSLDPESVAEGRGAATVTVTATLDGRARTTATQRRDEDSGGRTGWSIANAAHSFYAPYSTWGNNSTLMIEVRGTVNPVTIVVMNSDTLEYSLEGTDAASFDIDSTSGQIQTKSGVTYDHEAKDSYSVTVKADDGNGSSDTVPGDDHGHRRGREAGADRLRGAVPQGHRRELDRLDPQRDGHDRHDHAAGCVQRLPGAGAGAQWGDAQRVVALRDGDHRRPAEGSDDTGPAAAGGGRVFVKVQLLRDGDGFHLGRHHNDADPAYTDSGNNPVSFNPTIAALQTTDDRIFTTTVTPHTEGVNHNYTLTITVPANTVTSVVDNKSNEAAAIAVRVAPPRVTVPISSIGRTSTLKWLGQGASGESPGSIKSEVAKLTFLRQLGAHEWDLSDLNPNRRKFLAQVGRRSTSQTLQRMPDRRRYPILVVLLHETTLDLVDEIVDLFNRALKKTDSRSRRELEAWRVATAQATNEKVRLFSRLGRLVLDPDIPDEQLRRRIFEGAASRELFAAAVEETEQLLRPRDGSYLDFVENRYGHLRKFAPLVLRVLDFKSLKTDDPLIDAVEILRELNRKRRRRVPEDAGLEFASAKWRGQLLGSDGRVNRRSLRALCSLPTP